MTFGGGLNILGYWLESSNPLLTHHNRIVRWWLLLV
jgi:hypothetical protein